MPSVVNLQALSAPRMASVRSGSIDFGESGIFLRTRWGVGRVSLSHSADRLFQSECVYKVFCLSITLQAHVVRFYTTRRISGPPRVGAANSAPTSGPLPASHDRAQPGVEPRLSGLRSRVACRGSGKRTTHPAFRWFCYIQDRLSFRIANTVRGETYRTGYSLLTLRTSTMPHPGPHGIRCFLYSIE